MASQQDQWVAEDEEKAEAVEDEMLAAVEQSDSEESLRAQPAVLSQVAVALEAGCAMLRVQEALAQMQA